MIVWILAAAVATAAPADHAAVKALVSKGVTGRRGDVDGARLVKVSDWKGAACSSRFRQNFGDGAPLVWTVDWTAVRAVTLPAESRWGEEDEVTDRFGKGQVIRFEGRDGAFSYPGDRGHTVQLDSYDMVFGDTARAKAALTAFEKLSAACYVKNAWG